MFQQTWNILLDKYSKTYVNDWKVFFYITGFIYIIYILFCLVNFG